MSVRSLSVPFVHILRKTCNENGYTIRKHGRVLGIATTKGSPSELWSLMIDALVPDRFHTHEEIDVMRHHFRELSDLMRHTFDIRTWGADTVFYNPNVLWAEEYEEGFDPEEDSDDVSP